MVDMFRRAWATHRIRCVPGHVHTRARRVAIGDQLGWLNPNLPPRRALHDRGQGA